MSNRKTQDTTASAFLSGLNFTTVKKTATVDVTVAARDKLLEAISAQLTLAAEFLEHGKILPRKKDKREKGSDGAWTTTEVEYVPRTWWFTHDGQVYANVRYGNRPLVFENGKSAIVIGDNANIIPTLELVYKAVAAKELDAIIMSTRKRIKKAS